ncbi:class I SAM-dependent methyltransferase [Salinisphaera sp. Q1T1-3]|uniref:class I SAM-dependent methyltransferase n=1 Tax=Salinisphaera sp. Q1T1-3 TaxID=2321229 RepID=UPI000E763861|nr:class I SAM-dependent methyltransferase [Salinisphaera sp. Q1T1-3]RJS94692.1 hypothetical protein D3260_02645 [Salinisphaera sp. Q1T1-3]
MRNPDQILDAYRNNRDITRDECRQLYELVDDPWGLGSSINHHSYLDVVARLDKYIRWEEIDWIVDYGSGIGTFTRAVKDRHPHIKSLAVDFDTAHEAARRRFGADIFDHQFGMNTEINEHDLINHTFPDLDIDRLCICFFNSINYVFKDLKKRKRPKALSRLVRHFEGLARQPDTRYLIASSNFFDSGANQAMQRRDLELIYLSRDLELDNEEPDFKAELHTRVWQRRAT